MPYLLNRELYHNDGGVRWARLPAMVVAGSAAALVLGFVLQCLFRWGWYFIILVPCLLAIPLAALTFWLVDWTHCRNRWIACSFGIMLGALFYLSYFHFCMTASQPQLLWNRVDLLPRYILLRMQSDIHHSTHERREVEREPSAFTNWSSFAMEFAFVALIPSLIGYACSQRGYSREQKRWMSRETALLSPFSIDPLVSAMNRGALAEFVQSVSKRNDVQSSAQLTIEYVQGAGSPLDHPAFLSIEDWPIPPNPRKKVVRKKLVRQVRLTNEELLAFQPLFSKLSNAMSTPTGDHCQRSTNGL